MYRDNLDVQRRILGDDHTDAGATMYYLGCVAALQGRTEASIEWLRQAIEAGFRGAASLAEEEDLQSLRGLSQFETLVQRVSGAKQQDAG
jgi:hypothetical protein